MTTTAPHQIAFGKFDHERGEVTQGLGFTKKVEEKSGSGHFRLTYAEALGSDGATVVSSYPDSKHHVRNNWFSSDNTKETRRKNAAVDCYQLPEGSSGKVEEDPCDFYVLSAAANEGQVAAFAARGSDQPIAVVAGAVGPGFSAGVAHGSFTVSSGGDDEDPVASYLIHVPKATFTSAPTVVVTPQQSVASVLIVEVDEVKPNDDDTHWVIEVTIRDVDWVLVKGAFQFLAVGAAPAGKGSTGRLVSGVVHLNGKETLAGSGFTPTRVTKPAQYKVTFGQAFTQTPVVIASTEHEKDKHLRQAQVHDVGTGSFQLDVYGAFKGSGWNSARYHFLAYAPT